MGLKSLPTDCLLVVRENRNYSGENEHFHQVIKFNITDDWQMDIFYVGDLRRTHHYLYSFLFMGANLNLITRKHQLTQMEKHVVKGKEKTKALLHI